MAVIERMLTQDGNPTIMPRRRGLPLRLLVAAAVVGSMVVAGKARAEDATWLLDPTVAGPVAGTSDFDAGTNWNSTEVPDGTALFGPTNQPDISLSSAFTQLGGWTFNTGAADYTITNTEILRFDGAGIVINGGSLQLINTDDLEFRNSSSAGDATIANGGSLTFFDDSSAGDSIIASEDLLSFFDDSSAANAQITNDDRLFFYGNSSAGNATITNVGPDGQVFFTDNATAGTAKIDNSGLVQFINSSTAGAAEITNFGIVDFEQTSSGEQARFINDDFATFDISHLTSAGTTVGSIEGGGAFFIGHKTLTTGSNNLSTEVSGIISGVGGSLTKVGTGTLTLTGENSFTGPLAISQGTLTVANDQGPSQVGKALADSVVVDVAEGATFNVARSEKISGLTGAGAVTHDSATDETLFIDDSGDYAFSGNVSDGPADFAIWKDGTGIQTLSGDIDIDGGIQVNGGTLVLSGNNAFPLVTVVGGARLRLESDGAAGGGSIRMNPDTTVSFGDGVTNSTPIELGGSGGTVHLEVLGTDTAEQAGSMQGIPSPLLLSIDKNGTGTLLLSGNAVHTGTTSISEGTLLVNGSIDSPSVAVRDGATLGGSGAITGTVTVDDGGMLTPGASPGTLTVGGLVLNDGSVLEYELGPAGIAGSGINDLIEVNGNLTLDGTLNVTDAGGFGPGIYRLMDYTGALTDNGLDLGTLPAGTNAADLFVQTTVAGQVNLISSAGATLGFWDGGDAALHDDGAVSGGDGTWVAANRNWTQSDGTINGRWKQGFAIFSGAAGTVAVDDTAGPVLVTGMQFMTDGYTITGDTLTTDTADTIIRTDAGVTATIAASISGSGGLDKTHTGTLVLTGINSYTGGTTITAGTLVGDTDAIRGDITNSATVVFDQAADAAFAGDIGGTGDLVKSGAGTLTLAGTSTLDWSVLGGSLISAADRFSGNVAIGSGASFTFDQATDATYAGTLSGDGDFVKRGAARLILSGDSSAFSGATTVGAGTLAVDGALGGMLDVLAGARLEGNGTAGATTLASGATIAPGYSIGTLTVAGGFAAQPGSVYEVEVDAAGRADRIDVTGAATLNGGAVQVLAADGDYAPRTAYTILSADDGVNGRFDSLSSNLAFLDPSLEYGDPNAVMLTLTRNDIDFAAVADTYNQRAAASGIESLGVGNAVYDAIVGLDAASARAAYDAISGEAYASAQSALLGDSRYLRGAVSDRLSHDCIDVRRPKAQSAPGDHPCGTALWTRSYGTWGHQDGDGNAARLDHNIHGLFIGADTLVAGTWRLGFLAGYSHATSNVNARASLDASDSYSLGLYTATHWGQLGFHAGAAYAWHNIDSERDIGFTGYSSSAKADYHAHTAQVFTELGYDLDFGRTALTPFARAAYVHLDTDSFDESGGAAALHDSGKSNALGVSTLGVRLSSVLDATDTSTIRAHGLVGWRHAYGDVTPEASLWFDGGEHFTVAGVPLARDALALEAGLDADLSPRLSLGASYMGQFGDGVESNGVKATLAWRF